MKSWVFVICVSGCGRLFGKYKVECFEPTGRIIDTNRYLSEIYIEVLSF